LSCLAAYTIRAVRMERADGGGTRTSDRMPVDPKYPRLLRSRRRTQTIVLRAIPRPFPAVLHFRSASVGRSASGFLSLRRGMFLTRTSCVARARWVAFLASAASHVTFEILPFPAYSPCLRPCACHVASRFCIRRVFVDDPMLLGAQIHRFDNFDAVGSTAWFRQCSLDLLGLFSS
jgi:hypothetical protein